MLGKKNELNLQIRQEIFWQHPSIRAFVVLSQKMVDHSIKINGFVRFVDSFLVLHTIKLRRGHMPITYILSNRRNKQLFKKLSSRWMEKNSDININGIKEN